VDSRVEISSSGRAGSISYHEGANTASFDWEFALPPALALVSGPGAKLWDRRYPWAAGRQGEVYEVVAREVVRQEAPGCRFKLDLEEGVITVLLPPRPKSLRRRPTAKPRHTELEEIAELSKEDRKRLINALIAEGMTGPVVEALGSIDEPDARAAVDEASRDHLSVDIRLAAAEVMHTQGRLKDLETVLAREIRMLNEPRDGLARALRLASLHPTETVKQALLWASWNTTDCAPECARLLLTLTGTAREPLSTKVEAMLGKLGLHNSYFDRKAAFDALCQQLGMKLADTSLS
jgi:hypothetical protein